MTASHARHEAQKGFTLIELSIVLVIIGLIVGGVLAGRELISVAYMRKGVSQYQQITVAIGTFKNKYNCLPGDCANATSFFTLASAQLWGGPTPQGPNGNGDGKITIYDPDDATGSYGEGLYRVWEHLSKAGLIPGTYNGSSPDPFDRRITRGVSSPDLTWIGRGDVNWGSIDTFKPDAQTFVVNYDYLCLTDVTTGCEANQLGLLDPFNRTGTNRLILAGFRSYSGSYYYSAAGLKCSFARQLDEKIDDGKPLTGKMKIPGGSNVNSSYCASGTDRSQNYADDSKFLLYLAYDLPF